MSGKLFYLFSFVSALVLAGSAWAAEDPSLVIHYSFDNFVKVVADQSGKGNDGAVNGDVTEEPVGKFNGAAKFANGGYLDLDGDNFPAGDIPTSAVTLAAWVKCEYTGEHHAIFDARTWAGTWIIHPELRSDGQFRWVLRASGMSPIFDVRAGSVTWDQWLHYAGTYDAETGRAVLYINGQVVSELDLPSGRNIANDWGDGARVGLNIANTRPFTGLMDEFYLFKRALSHSEVKKLMYGPGWPYASDPSPAENAVHSNTVANLGWTAGVSAISHDVYVGENFDDVNDGAEGTFCGNRTLTYYIAGASGSAYPGGLVPGTAYYWRIDEVTADGTIYKGDVWSFRVPPNTAYAPDPADGAKFIDTDVELSWTAGLRSKLHTVYFGENYDDVNSAAGGSLQPNTTDTRSALESGKTYYWRIDEFGTGGTNKGEVWSFTTAGTGGGIKGDYYRGLDLRDLTLTRIEPQINFNWSLSGPDQAVGNDNYSARWTGELEVPISDTYSFYPKVQGGARLWINDQLLLDKWYDYGIDERWQDHFPVEYHRATYLEAGVYPIVMEFTYRQSFGGGAVVQLEWGSPSTPKQIIPQAAFSLPVAANRPSPSNGAVDIRQTATLSWSPGYYAASHQIYFGTDEQAVENADTDSPEYKGPKELGSEAYDPGKLEWDTTYHWRIDQVDTDGTITKGRIWSFTTANFLIVDDFERYNDFNPSDPESNRIFMTWEDGLGYGSPGQPPYFAGNGTGSIIGNAEPPFAEQYIVHGGRQSMPYEYNSGVADKLKYSQADMTLVYPRDWTENGVSKLMIWFRGNPDNAAEPMYVALNGSAIVYHDDSSATQIDTWTQWAIDLQKFADQGLDLTNVNMIAIGFGNRNNPQPGGSGLMFFDDIRLEKPPEGTNDD
jgi:hypothetical protein